MQWDRTFCAACRRAPPRAWSQVWSFDASTIALSALTGTPQASVPADVAEWLEDDTPGAHLVVLDGARECVQLADVEGWQRFMQSLHEAWVEPLYEAVKRRIVGDATLYPADGSAWCLDTRAARRWWVRPRPLTVLAPSAHALGGGLSGPAMENIIVRRVFF